MKSIRNSLPLVLVACLIQPIGGANAQTASGYDLASIQAACVAEVGCKVAVAAAIQQILNAGLTVAEVNVELGILAVELVEIAGGASDGMYQAISEALDAVADACSDPEQSSAIEEIADQVADGNADDVDLDGPVGGSPA